LQCLYRVFTPAGQGGGYPATLVWWTTIHLNRRHRPYNLLGYPWKVRVQQERGQGTIAQDVLYNRKALRSMEGLSV
jgi:hypothetical protein